jgi:serine/threonine protein kinase
MFENSSTVGPTEMTRKYAAPGVLSGADKNSSSDIFSLGCVFIQMYSALTGMNLFINEPNFNFSASMSTLHIFLCQKNPDFEEYPVPCAIFPMTTKDPDQRWTAHKLWQHLATIPGYSCGNCAINKTLSSDGHQRPTGRQDSPEQDPPRPTKKVVRETYLTKTTDLRFVMPLRGLTSDDSPYQDSRLTDPYGPRSPYAYPV